MYKDKASEKEIQAKKESEKEEEKVRDGRTTHKEHKILHFAVRPNSKRNSEGSLIAYCVMFIWLANSEDHKLYQKGLQSSSLSNFSKVLQRPDGTLVLQGVEGALCYRSKRW